MLWKLFPSVNMYTCKTYIFVLHIPPSDIIWLAQILHCSSHYCERNTIRILELESEHYENSAPNFIETSRQVVTNFRPFTTMKTCGGISVSFRSGNSCRWIVQWTSPSRQLKIEKTPNSHQWCKEKQQLLCVLQARLYFPHPKCFPTIPVLQKYSQCNHQPSNSPAFQKNDI